MSKSILHSVVRNGSVVLIVAGLLSLSSVAGAANNNKPAAPKPAPAAKPAARPSGGSGGGASHGPTAGGFGSHGTTHGPTTGGAVSHGPTANGGGFHGPSANRGGFHGPNANGGGAHTTTGMSGAANTHMTTGGGGRANATLMNNRGNVSGRTSGPGSNHSAFNNSVPRGGNERVTRGGNAVRTRPSGRVSDVHDARRGMDVHHGLNGNRRVSVERPGHGRLVAERGRPGYAQRGYNYHGRDFGRRAYYYHGHEYNRYYRGYGYHGVYLNVYAPGFYYGPGFYGWAYNPWAVPIAFGWGWAGNPWFGYYGYYFQPYPVYPSAAFWLTDYMISQDLQAVYAAHQEAGEEDGVPSSAGGPPALSPDVKQQIADEVKNQLALENAEAQQNAQHQDVDPGSSGIARMLADGHPHVFVAGDALDLVDASGQECGVSDGDVLLLQTPPPADATDADLVVQASKGGQECRKGSTVTVQLTDLQEMQNQMRATIDQGLQELQANQGKNGLPPAPPSAQVKPAETEYAQLAPPADPQDAADLQQQNQQADQAEKDVTTEAAQENGTPAGVAVTAPVGATPAVPSSVELGQTPDQVKASLGAPARVANLGPKVIYYYDGMKVVFKDGKVSDVQ